MKAQYGYSRQENGGNMKQPNEMVYGSLWSGETDIFRVTLSHNGQLWSLDCLHLDPEQRRQLAHTIGCGNYSTGDLPFADCNQWVPITQGSPQQIKGVIQTLFRPQPGCESLLCS